MTAIDPKTAPTQTFDWGIIKWLVTPERNAGAKISFGEVILLPGEGHTRHNHPTSEEILYVLSGNGEQMLNDQQPFAITPGDTIYVPMAAYHSTLNTGWQPLRLLALYNPGGPDRDLVSLPDFREVAAGRTARLTRV